MKKLGTYAQAYGKKALILISKGGYKRIGAGIEESFKQIMAVAKAACAENDTLYNMPFEVTPESVAAALKAADAYGRYYLGEE